MTCTCLRLSSRYVKHPGDALLLLPGKGRKTVVSGRVAQGGPGEILVFFHGAGEDAQAVLENGNLSALADAWNLGILLPSVGNSFGLNQGEGEQIHSFLAEELLPWLRGAFSIPLCVGGISMGAYIALSLGLERRDMVERIVSISGAFDLRKAAQFGRICGLELPPALTVMEDCPGESIRRLLEREGGRPRLYFTCGSGDLFYDVNQKTADRARELGYPTRWEACPGLHNWNCWKAAVTSALRWAARAPEEEGGDSCSHVVPYGT